MNKQLGGVLLASASQFGKYAALATAIGGVLVGFGVHNASKTSADNPSGQR